MEHPIMRAGLGWAMVGDAKGAWPDYRMPDEPSGGVYAIEFDSGQTKIGCSGNPGFRVVQIIRQTEAYGNWKAVRVAISRGCWNYHGVESALHRHFEGCWVSGELFRATIEEIEIALLTVPLQVARDLVREEARLEMLKQTVMLFHEPGDRITGGREIQSACDEDEELLDHLGTVPLMVQAQSRSIGFHVWKELGLPADALPGIGECIAQGISSAVFAAYGPKAACVIVETDDGYRYIDYVPDLDSIRPDLKLVHVMFRAS